MIRDFVGYQSADKDFQGIRLNANEGVRGSYKYYPLKRDKNILEIFSRLYGLPSEKILMDRGIDGILEVLFNAIVNKDDVILGLSPTYGMYSILSKLRDAKYEEVSSDSLKIAVESGKPKIVFLCRPNNPTGQIMPRSKVVELLEVLPRESFLVIDEAYIEFDKQETLTDLVEEYENVIILRTLSKAYSLASLRVGFGFCHESLVQKLIPFQAPYPISGIVLDFLKANFNSSYIEETETEIKRICLWREKLKKFFSSTGGNFLYLKDENAENLYKNFKNENILIRYFENQSAIRISIGSDEEMKLVELLCEKWL